jgi:hypothetical protein
MNLKPIEKLAYEQLKVNRVKIEKHPEKEINPNLMLICGDPEDQASWTYKLIIFQIFDENRFAIMEMIGRDLASQHVPIVAVILVSESWLSEQRVGSKRIEPRSDPNRKEVLMSAALTIDLQSVFLYAEFNRNDKVVFGELKTDLNVGKSNNIILLKLIQAYAEQVQDENLS